MNERIRKLRKALDMTQQAFADKLGVKRNTVGQWECGINSITDQIVLSICREFNVNEDWLRYGTGEMFITKESDEIDSLVKKYGLSNDDRILIEKYVDAKESSRKAIIDFIVDVSSALGGATFSEGIPSDPPDDSEDIANRDESDAG